MSSIECETSLNCEEAPETSRRSEAMKQMIVPQFGDDEIIAGWKFKMQYLGCGDDLKFGGTDHELANVIHDIHVYYTGKMGKLRKARSVIVFVDSMRINIYNENEDELLLTFPLVYIKDVTTGVDIAPYSKTCVLVAKKQNERHYKPFVFYCKSSARAAEFYHFTTSAFQYGFKCIENASFNSYSTAEEIGASGDESSLSDKVSSERGEGNCIEEFDKIATESQKLLNNEERQLGPNGEKKFSPQQQTVTVKLANTSNNITKHEKLELKFNPHLDDYQGNLPPSKLNVFMDTVGESSKRIIPHWFRSSYRKFRRMTNRNTAEEISQTV